MFERCVAGDELTAVAVLLGLCLVAGGGCSGKGDGDIRSKESRGTQLTQCLGDPPVCGDCWRAVCSFGDWDCTPTRAGAACAGPRGQCVASQCDGGGSCVAVYNPVTDTCNDGQACTYNDHCNGAGSCVGTPITCTGTLDCNSLSCNGTSTCTKTPLPLGTSCTDGNNCTFNDHCDGAGSCATSPISLCSTTTCGAGGCNAVIDLVDTIRVDATAKGLVTFKTALASHGACCASSSSCNPASLAFDASTPGGEAVLALVTAAKLGGQKINAIGKGTCTVYPGPSGTVSEDWTYGTLVP